MTTSYRPRRSRGAIIAVSAGIALIVAVACESPVPDPIAPTFASGADTVRTESLARVERDGGSAYRSLDCKTNVQCGADSIVRLGYLIKTDVGEVTDSVVGQIITVTGRRSGKAFTVVRDHPGADAVREVQGVRLVQTDSTPR